MKIGELARQLGVSVATLRFYEQRGLARPGRSEGGTRHYDDEDMARFRAIRDLVRLEVPLETLAGLAGIRPAHRTGDSASKTVDGYLESLEVELLAKERQIRATLADLRRARERLTACHGCRKRPTRHSCAPCPAAGELLATHVMRIVWDADGER